MTTQFTEADHPRGPGGKFAVKPEQDGDLFAPAPAVPARTSGGVTVIWPSWIRTAPVSYSRAACMCLISRVLAIAVIARSR